MTTLLVLSHIQAVQLLNAKRNKRSTALVSTDLNLTRIEVKINLDCVTFGNNRQLSWSAVEEIATTPNSCFNIQENGLHRIQNYSETTNRFCSLLPTESAPALLVAGFPMHRIKDTDPYHDTLSKLKAIKPVVGQVLDTATGLGYTAIEASRTANHVITIELDPAVLDIARLNPWSQRLFDNPQITQLIGDSCEVIQEFNDSAFARIIHDPPNMSLAGELYSETFFRELFRVLTRSGRLFHYLGDLNSSSGRRVVRGVIHRLIEAGFRQVLPCPQAFGVLAYK